MLSRNSFASKVLDNLHVALDDIHLRYQGSARHPYAIGVTLASLATAGVDECPVTRAAIAAKESKGGSASLAPVVTQAESVAEVHAALAALQERGDPWVHELTEDYLTDKLRHAFAAPPHFAEIDLGRNRYTGRCETCNLVWAATVRASRARHPHKCRTGPAHRLKCLQAAGASGQIGFKSF